MHNTPKPKLEDLPTKAQLRRSSIIAGIGAVAIGVMVYMPAELGHDPTGCLLYTSDAADDRT